MKKMTFDQVPEKEKQLLKEWYKHQKRQKKQREKYNKMKKEVKPGEAVLVGDYKQNWDLAFFGSILGVIKRVYTILSRVLTHTLQVVLHCLQSILERDEFVSMKKINWWSDGGSCFKSKEFGQSTLSGLKRKDNQTFHFALHYFESQHGKSDIDSIFGLYANLIQLSLPCSGINTLHQMIDFLQFNVPENLKQVVLEYDIDKLNVNVKKLKLNNFQKYLNYEVIDGMFYASQSEESGGVVVKFESESGKCTNKVKKSDVSIDYDDMSKEIIQMELDKLNDKN
ncbi:MAG: hypothetical protein EZS28_003970 [Streblomastix strix]|uniref:Uncharacterized protein n=1 Tax=Streblomastix strix TaxID=222440 RepID=A0A5J4X210_9EUKA|nr:MAG: hypothetical protein EZS28_003970 [Streblomastix strix]